MHYLPDTIPAEAAEALRPAFDRSLSYTADEWIDRCKADTAQLWRDGDLWAVTEVCQTKEGRAVKIVATAGVYCDSLLPEIEAWARGIGCNRCFFVGRKGWARRLPGYSISTITMEKVI